MMFFGRERVSMDPKGRTSVPARYRDTMRRAFRDPEDPQAATIIMLPWFRQCLRAYTLVSYERMLENFETAVREAEFLGASDDESDLRRMLYGGAMEMQFDNHGRIVLPRHLRDEAGLDGEVYWTAGGDYLELWNPDRLFAQESGERQDTLRAQFARLSRPRPSAPARGGGEP
jgi:MraZ protein